jgi:hypothetical protein
VESERIFPSLFLRHLLKFFPLLLQAVFFDFSKKLIKVYSIARDREENALSGTLFQSAAAF